MKCYAFIENDRINGMGQCEIFSPTITVVEVSEEVFNKFLEDPDYLTWDGKNVILNPDYEKIKAKQREDEFNRNFFLTHLGYVKREVTMKSGAVKDFLTDLRHSLRVGLPIFVYDKPDFTKEVTNEAILATQKIVQADEQFLADCDNQFALDFYGFNPLEMMGQLEQMTQPVEEPKTEEGEE